MADAVIICTSDRRAAADRLRIALSDAGYSVGTDPKQALDQPSSTAEKMAAASAVIVIWSKEALLNEVVHAAVKDARRQGKLVEVTMDGIKPAGTVDAELRVALLSGWRGEPFHPGWQKILAELKRLCGSPRGARVRAGSEQSSKDGGSAPGIESTASTKAPLRAMSSRARLLSLIAAVMATLMLLGAATSWLGMKRSASDGAVSDGRVRVVSRGTAPAALDRPLRPPAPEPASPPALPAASQVAVPNDAEASVPRVRPEAAAVEAAGRKREQSPARAVAQSPSATMRLFCERSGRGTRECRAFSRRMAKETSTSDERRSSAATGPARVSYRYSRNMQRFCEGAGRGTPECRLFRRRLRGAD